MISAAACLLLAHHDGRSFDRQPSLSGHCGHKGEERDAMLAGLRVLEGALAEAGFAPR